MRHEGNDFPCIIASPLCEDIRWNIDLIPALVEELSENHVIDPQRIYLTGISIGGMATWQAAIRFPSIFAAIIPICGAGDSWNAFRISHVPCWAFHGKQDEIVPVAETEKMISELSECGGTPRCTIYDDGSHDIWDRAYQNHELWDWLFSQTKQNAAASDDHSS